MISFKFKGKIMANRSETILAKVIFVVGVLNACALFGGFYLLNVTVKEKRLPSTSTSINQDNVVPLSEGRFAVINSSRITVFRVDGQNRVVRLNEVDTYWNNMRPVTRKDYNFPN